MPRTTIQSSQLSPVGIADEETLSPQQQGASGVKRGRRSADSRKSFEEDITEYRRKEEEFIDHLAAKHRLRRDVVAQKIRNLSTFRPERAVNKYNAFESVLKLDVNDPRITICSKERLIQLQQIAKEHGYENTHDDILVEMVEIGKHLRMLKATCPYESKQGQASDVTRTLKQIDENLRNLELRSGVSSLRISVKTTFDQTIAPNYYSDAVTEKYVETILKKSMKELALTMEGFAVSGIVGQPTAASNVDASASAPTGASTTITSDSTGTASASPTRVSSGVSGTGYKPSIPTKDERKAFLKGEIRKLISDGLKEITGKSDIRMSWKRYGEAIVNKYHVRLANWPLPPPTPSTSTSEPGTEIENAPEIARITPVDTLTEAALQAIYIGLVGEKTIHWEHVPLNERIPTRTQTRTRGRPRTQDQTPNTAEQQPQTPQQTSQTLQQIQTQPQNQAQQQPQTQQQTQEPGPERKKRKQTHDSVNEPLSGIGVVLKCVIQEKVDKGLREITGNMGLVMSWDNYENEIVKKYRVRLVNWPTYASDSDHQSSDNEIIPVDEFPEPALFDIHRALGNEGNIHWERIPD